MFLKEKEKISKKHVLLEEYRSSSDDEDYYSDVPTDISLSGSLNAASAIKKPVLPTIPRQLKLPLKKYNKKHCS